MRNRGNVVAIGIGLLALVVATTGTAVAVTVQAVSITDPSSPQNHANVSAKGRLSVATPHSDFNQFFAVTIGDNRFVGPTKATLVVTRVAAENSGLNSGYPNTTFRLQLAQVTVGSDGTCSDTDADSTTLSLDRLPAAGQIEDSYPSGLQFKPIGGKAYCIVFYLSGETTNPSTYYLPYTQLTGYVAAGTYSSSRTMSAGTLTSTLKATPANPRPRSAAPR